MINFLDKLLKNNIVIDSIYLNQKNKYNLPEYIKYLSIIESNNNLNKKLTIYLEIDFEYIQKNYEFLKKNIENDRLIILVFKFDYYICDDLNKTSLDKLIHFQKIINITSTLRYPIHFKNITDESMILYMYKNNFKGCIYDYNLFIKNKINQLISLNYELCLPNKNLILDSFKVLEMALQYESKYLLNSNATIKNSNIKGAFKTSILENFSESLDEDILIDKASILIYKKILSRYYFLKLNRKARETYNKLSNFVIDKETDIKIIKIGFNHYSKDRIPIDFSEWKLEEYISIYEKIKIVNLIDNRFCYGNYNDTFEEFIYDINLYKTKKHLDIIESDDNYNDLLLNSVKNSIHYSKMDFLFSDKLQNIFPCNNKKFIDASLKNNFNHILDLEDSVSFFEKNKARENLVSLFQDELFLKKIKNKTIWIRINDMASPESTKDLLDVVYNKNILNNIKGFILPKVSNKTHIDTFISSLKTIENKIFKEDNTFIRGRLFIQVLIENCEGLYNINDIISYNGIVSLISGLYDYKNSVGSWDFFNQYPSLIYQKKKIIDTCERNNIISVESITPVLNFEKSFIDFYLSYNINFVTKWSIYPSHITGNKFSKKLDLFFENDLDKHIHLLYDSLNLVKYYRYIPEIDILLDKIKIYKDSTNKSSLLLSEIRKKINNLDLSKLHKKKNFVFKNYYINHDTFYNFNTIIGKYNSNESLVNDCKIDKRNLLSSIEPISIKVNIDNLNNIFELENYDNIDNLVIHINDESKIEQLDFIKKLKQKISIYIE